MTDALHIATLAAGETGRLGLCRLPGLLGDLDVDLGAIVGWNPDIVVSTTTARELTAAGSDDLGQRLQLSGIAWSHMPIAGLGGPDGESEALWARLSERVHASLDGDRGVLFHCRGGFGRSGMMVLRILVERGEDARQALGRLRTAQPGAVETDEQLRWAGAIGWISVDRRGL